LNHQPEAQHQKSSAIHKPKADYPIYGSSCDRCGGVAGAGGRHVDRRLQSSRRCRGARSQLIVGHPTPFTSGIPVPDRRGSRPDRKRRHQRPQILHSFRHRRDRGRRNSYPDHRQQGRAPGHHCRETDRERKCSWFCTQMAPPKRFELLTRKFVVWGSTIEIIEVRSHRRPHLGRFSLLFQSVASGRRSRRSRPLSGYLGPAFVGLACPGGSFPNGGRARYYLSARLGRSGRCSTDAKLYCHARRAK
jgi:hypothetical protein